jgi:glutamate--cysteine ligase
MLALAFQFGMGFERYVDYALDVPLYFVKRGDHYQDGGCELSDLLAGRRGSAAEARHVMIGQTTSRRSSRGASRAISKCGADVGPPERHR